MWRQRVISSEEGTLGLSVLSGFFDALHTCLEEASSRTGEQEAHELLSELGDGTTITGWSRWPQGLSGVTVEVFLKFLKQFAVDQPQQCVLVIEALDKIESNVRAAVCLG